MLSMEGMVNRVTPVPNSAELWIIIGAPVNIPGVVRPVFQAPDVRVGFRPPPLPRKSTVLLKVLDCGMLPGDNRTPDSTRSHNGLQRGLHQQHEPCRDCHNPNVILMEDCDSVDSWDRSTRNAVSMIPVASLLRKANRLTHGTRVR